MQYRRSCRDKTNFPSEWVVPPLSNFIFKRPLRSASKQGATSTSLPINLRQYLWNNYVSSFIFVHYQRGISVVTQPVPRSSSFAYFTFCCTAGHRVSSNNYTRVSTANFMILFRSTNSIQTHQTTTDEVVTLRHQQSWHTHLPRNNRPRMVALKNVNIFYGFTRHHHVQTDRGALSTPHSELTGELFARQRRDRTLYVASQLRVSEVIRQ
jgi:hypothetical protein